MQSDASDIYLIELQKERAHKSGHLQVVQPDDLAQIHREDINLVIWNRSVLPSLVQWLDREIPSGFQQSVFEVTPQNAAAKIGQVVDLYWNGESPGKRIFASNLAALVDLFAGIAKAKRFKARLELNRTRPESRFHMDDVPLRLLTIYAGAGTEWLEGSSTDCRPSNEQDSSGGHRFDRERIHRIDRFAVAVLKGRTYPGAQGKGLVHRSPPTSKAAEGRLVYSLAPIF